MVIVGTGNLTYDVVEDWGQLPRGWRFKQVAGVAVDAEDRVYVFTRSPHPVIVFNREGRFITSWGEGHFSVAHGICIGPDGCVYLADSKDHTVKKFSGEGDLLITLGTKDTPSEQEPFNRPTNVALAPDNTIYVSDGYGNARVHKFSPEGRLLLSWGAPGKGRGEFNTPHSLAVDKTGRVFVCDRENHRIQVFTPNGEYIAEWGGLLLPADIHIDKADVVYVAELQSRVSVFTLDGRLLARWGFEKSRVPDKFFAPHGVCTDSRGDLYVGDVFLDRGDVPEGRRVLKYVRRSAKL